MRCPGGQRVPGGAGRRAARGLGGGSDHDQDTPALRDRLASWTAAASRAAAASSTSSGSKLSHPWPGQQGGARGGGPGSRRQTAQDWRAVCPALRRASAQKAPRVASLSLATLRRRRTACQVRARPLSTRGRSPRSTWVASGRRRYLPAPAPWRMAARLPPTKRAAITPGAARTSAPCQALHPVASASWALSELGIATTQEASRTGVPPPSSCIHTVAPAPATFGRSPTERAPPSKVAPMGNCARSWSGKGGARYY